MNTLAKARRNSAIQVNAARVSGTDTAPGSGRVWWMARNNSGVFVDEQTALTYTAVWRAINLISFTTAMLSFGVFQRQGKTRTRHPEDPIHWQLNYQSSPDMAAFWTRATMQSHVLGWGNGYAEIERTRGGSPVGEHLITPDRVVPDFDRNGRLIYDVRNPRQPNTVFEANDILHFKGLGFDGLVGYSPIKLFRNNLGASMAAEKFTAGYFGNGARPGGVLQSDKEVSPETARRIRESWNELHQGPDAAGRIAVLEDGLKWESTGLDPQVSQLIETRKFGLDDVARIFDVPPHKLSNLDRATFSNIEHQGIEWVTDCLLRWCKMQETECDIKLLGRERVLQGFYTRINLDGLLRGDSTTRASVYDRLAKLGVYSINDIRELEDLDPVEGGDLRFVQANLCPLSKAEALLPMSNKPSGGTDNGGADTGAPAA